MEKIKLIPDILMGIMFSTVSICMGLGFIIYPFLYPPDAPILLKFVFFVVGICTGGFFIYIPLSFIYFKIKNKESNTCDEL